MDLETISVADLVEGDRYRYEPYGDTHTVQWVQEITERQFRIMTTDGRCSRVMYDDAPVLRVSLENICGCDVPYSHCDNNCLSAGEW